METQKPIFYTEASYALGLILLSLATAFMTVADFGQSMVVAPAYLIHLWLVQYLPFFSFGMATYSFQAILLIAMVIVVRRFRVSYLFSFVTAVINGFLIDGFLLLVTRLPQGMGMRTLFFVLGVVVCSAGVALMFRSYVSPAVYEMFVKEIAERYGLSTARFKTVYDCVSFAVSVVLSFCFFGWLHLEGIGVGTAICALVNGALIGLIGKWLDARFRFVEGVPTLRRLFEK